MGAVTERPEEDLIVTVGVAAGPLPVVLAEIRQRAPVAVGVIVAVPRTSGPPVVAALIVNTVPVCEVVPARSQV